MRKAWMLSVIVPAFAAGLQVQAALGFLPSADKDKPQPVTVQGCLTVSGMIYNLTDGQGTTQQLTGGSHLNRYVGHEVQITGVPAIKTVDTTQDLGVGASVVEKPVFRVEAEGPWKDVHSAATLMSHAGGPSAEAMPVACRPSQKMPCISFTMSWRSPCIKRVS